MAKYHLHLAHLYGDLLNTYSDVGNIIALQYYAKQMDADIDVKVVSIDNEFNLPNKKAGIDKFINDGKPLLAICGGYQLLGHYYIGADGEKIPGLGILDHYTLSQDNHRFIGDITIKNEESNQEYHGFENHNGRTFLGKGERPLGKVISGNGNNGEDHTEGAIYKNTYCSYFHGPILTRNGEIAKKILLAALEHKYPDADLSSQKALKIKPTF